MSVYFNYTNLTPNSLARAGDVDARFLAVQAAFDKLPAPDKLQQDRQTFAVDTGGINTLVVALDFPLASYVVGLEITALVAQTNTGPTTINVDGVGVKVVKRSDGSPLGAGDLVAGTLAKIIYDGSAFRLMGASETTIASYTAQAAASAAASAASASASDGFRSNAATSAGNAANSATAAAGSASAAATSASDALAASAGKADKNNATFTGTNPVLPGAPTAALQAATKAYVDSAAFAAGSAYSADGSSITLTGGTFSLTTIATARLMGNVSGATAKPIALTGAQVNAMLPAATGALAGLLSAADKTKLDAITGTNTGDQTSVSGNAGTATKLATPRNIAISGAVTGTGTAFDGSASISIPITAMNMDSATAGVLAVARGGTGVATATGTGSNVLSASPALTGTPTAPTAAVDTNTTQLATTAFVIGQGYALAGHTHTIANVSGLQAALDSKASLGQGANFIDISANRGDGTGVIFLGAGARYLYYDNSTYVMPGCDLRLNGRAVLSEIDGKAAASHTHSYLPLSGGTLIGALNTSNDINSTGNTYLGGGGGNMATNAGGRLNVYSPDGADAYLSFHRSGVYAVNMGINTGGYFSLGGYSAAANLMALQLSTGNVEFSSSSVKAGGGRMFRHNDGARTSANVTISTSAPSGGGNGDVWFKV